MTSGAPDGFLAGFVLAVSFNHDMVAVKAVSNATSMGCGCEGARMRRRGNEDVDVRMQRRDNAEVDVRMQRRDNAEVDATMRVLKWA